MLKIVEAGNRRAVIALLSATRTRDAATERRVAQIVAGVRIGGDAALARYAKKLDGATGPLEIGEDEIRAAAATVPSDIRAALKVAARNIRKVAKRQVPKGWVETVAPGVSVENRVTPLDRVGWHATCNMQQAQHAAGATCNQL